MPQQAANTKSFSQDSCTRGGSIFARKKMGRYAANSYHVRKPGATVIPDHDVVSNTLFRKKKTSLQGNRIRHSY